MSSSNYRLEKLFISFLDSSGKNLIFSTFIGGPSLDAGRAVAFDKANNILAVGHISSSSHSTEGVFQESYGGGTNDAFITKFFRNGTLAYFSYLGGSDYDRANELVIDSEGNAIITGYTTNFLTINAYQSTFAGSCDTFITKVNPSGQNILFSTFLGGSEIDVGVV